MNIPTIIKLKIKKKRKDREKVIFEEEGKESLLAWSSWKVSLLLDGGRIGSTNWVLDEIIWD